MQKIKESRQVTRCKARLLLAEDTAQRQEVARQQEIAKLQAAPELSGPTALQPPPPDSSKRLKALLQASRRSQSYSQARRCPAMTMLDSAI